MVAVADTVIWSTQGLLSCLWSTSDTFVLCPPSQPEGTSERGLKSAHEDEEFWEVLRKF